MRIYRLNIHTHDHGNVVSWHGKRAEAVAAREAAKRDYGKDMDSAKIKAHDVPVGKAALLQFLNHDTPHNDNG